MIAEIRGDGTAEIRKGKGKGGGEVNGSICLYFGWVRGYFNGESTNVYGRLCSYCKLKYSST